MNEVQRAAAREDRKALAGRLKDAMDSGKVQLAEVVKATKSDPPTVLAWIAGIQVPQKKAARRLERLLDGIPAGKRS